MDEEKDISPKIDSDDGKLSKEELDRCWEEFVARLKREGLGEEDEK